MTVTDEVAFGDSSNSPSVSANARAIRNVTTSVGLACSRSIWLSIDRLTPLALASASSDQPRSPRKRFTRSPRWRLIDSGSVFRRGAVFVMFDIVDKRLAYRTHGNLLY